jgi:hypothetical protein
MGLSCDLLYEEMRRGNLLYLKGGRRRLITRPHLEQFLGITPGPWPSVAVTTASLKRPQVPPDAPGGEPERPV